MAAPSATPLARIAAIAVLAAVVVVGVLSVQRAAAQFFDERFPLFDRRGLFAPPPKPQVDFSRAPAPRKVDRVETADQSTVIVMGDSMADWLAFGLETAFTESPEVAIVRKPRTHSSLIYTPGRHDVRSRYVDWPVYARETLAKEPANFVVFMIGLSDREPIREPKPTKPGPGTAAKSATPPKTASPDAPPDPAQSSAGTEPQSSDDQQSATDQPAIFVDERGTAVYEFKSEKWVELYVKRIDETIAALKSKGVPVFWVGMPPVRGPKAMADTSYLNDLYRARAEKAGITYVDVWDGFVDDAGRYAQQGPDFEGQLRRLRAGDGQHFTQAGARKLAHYVEREIRRALTHSGPVAIPLPEQDAPQPAVATAPGMAVPRPLAGPVVPLNAINDQSDNSDELAGSSSVRQIVTDATASRLLIRGEALPAPAGRADDFAWPRRGVAAVGTDPVASTTLLPMTPMQAERAAAKATATAMATPAAQAAAAAARNARNQRNNDRQAQEQQRRQAYARSAPGRFFLFFFGR